MNRHKTLKTLATLAAAFGLAFAAQAASSYDSETKTLTYDITDSAPFTFTSDNWPSDGTLKVNLSANFNIESTTTNYAVFAVGTDVAATIDLDKLTTDTVATGNATIDGIFFLCDTADGTNTVKLCRKPYVWSNSDTKGRYYWTDSKTWSDGETVSDSTAKDFIVYGKRRIQASASAKEDVTETFPVNSTLTIVGGWNGGTVSSNWGYNLANKGGTYKMNHLTFGDYGFIIFAGSKTTNGKQHYTGHFYVVASDEKPGVIGTSSNGRSCYLDANLHGSGALRVSPFEAYDTPIYFGGDNSDFTGKLIFANALTGANKISQPYIGDNNALGGNNATLLADAVQLNGAELNVSNDVDMTSLPNRGFSVGEDSSIKVTEGKTFAIGAPVAIASGKTLTLNGAGTFAPTNTISGGTLAVSSGILQTKASATGNGIVINSTLTATDGITFTLADIQSAGTYPLFAAKTTTIDPSAVTITNPGYRVVVSSNETTIADETFTQYTAELHNATIISEDTTWDLSSEPRVLYNDCVINSGVTLTVVGGTLTASSYFGGEGQLVLSNATLVAPAETDTTWEIDIAFAPVSTNYIQSANGAYSLYLTGDISGAGTAVLTSAGTTNKGAHGVVLSGSAADFTGTMVLFDTNGRTCHKFANLAALSDQATYCFYNTDGSQRQIENGKPFDTSANDVPSYYPFAVADGVWNAGALSGYVDLYRLNYTNVLTEAMVLNNGALDVDTTLAGFWQNGYSNDLGKASSVTYNWTAASATCEYGILQTTALGITGGGTLKLTATDDALSSITVSGDGGTLDLPDGVSPNVSLTTTAAFTKQGVGTLTAANGASIGANLTISAGKVVVPDGVKVNGTLSIADGAGLEVALNALTASDRGRTLFSATSVDDASAGRVTFTGSEIPQGLEICYKNGTWYLDGTWYVDTTDATFDFRGNTVLTLASDGQLIGDVLSTNFTKAGSGKLTWLGTNAMEKLTIAGGTVKLATPLDISGINYDYDASDTNTFVYLKDENGDDTAFVTNWLSKVGGENRYVYGNAVSYDRGKMSYILPTQNVSSAIMNGKPALVSDKFRMIDKSTTDNETTFYVVQTLTPSATSFRFANDESDGWQGWRWYTGVDGNGAYYDQNSSGKDKKRFAWLDGAYSATPASVTDPFVIGFNVLWMRNNRGNSTGCFGNGEPMAYAEALSYNWNFTSNQMNVVSAYLMNKWGFGNDYPVQRLPQVIEMAAGTTLDLNGTTNTVQSFRGAGTVSNGALWVNDSEITVLGDLSVNAQNGKTYVIDAPCSSLALTGATAQDAVTVRVTSAILNGGIRVNLTIATDATVTTVAEEGMSIIDNGSGSYTVEWASGVYKWAVQNGDWDDAANWLVKSGDSWTAAVRAPMAEDSVVVPDTYDEVAIDFNGASRSAASITNDTRLVLNGGDQQLNVGHVFNQDDGDTFVVSNVTVYASGSALNITNGVFEIAAASTNVLSMSGVETYIYSKMTGSGVLKSTGSQLRFLNDNSEFAGTYETERTDTFFASNLCSSSNAVWKFSTSCSKDTDTRIFGGGTFYFGACDGYHQGGWNSPTVEIGARDDVDSRFTFRGRTTSQGVQTYCDIIKVGQAHLWLNARHANGNAHSGMIHSITIKGGSVWSQYVPTSFITFAGDGATLQMNTNGTENADALLLDPSAKIKNSTSAICFDDLGTNATWTSALAASNEGGFIKKGAGTLTLVEEPKYTGDTVVEAGTLVLTNGTVLAGDLAVTNGAKIGFISAISDADKALLTWKATYGNLHVKLDDFDVSGTLSEGSALNLVVNGDTASLEVSSIYTWTGNANNNLWSDAGNWSVGGEAASSAPSVKDVAQITNANVTVVVEVNQEFGRLMFAGDTKMRLLLTTGTEATSVFTLPKLSDGSFFPIGRLEVCGPYATEVDANGVVYATRVPSTFTWVGEDGDWSTVTNWTVKSLPTAVLPADNDSTVFPASLNAVVVTMGTESKVSNVWADAQLTLKGPQILRNNFYYGTGKLVLDGAKLYAQLSEDMVISNDIEVAENCTGFIHVASRRNCDIYGDITGKGLFQWSANTGNASDWNGLYFHGDNTAFAGTFEQTEGYSARSGMGSTTWKASSSNAVWYANSQAKSNGTAPFLQNSTDTYYFGAIIGAIQGGYCNAKFEIGNRDDVDSVFTFIGRSDGSGNQTGCYVTKVGSSMLAMKCGKHNGDPSKHLRGLTLKGGTTWAQYTPLEYVTFAGEDATLMMNTNGTDNADALLLDPSAVIKNSTAAICFHDGGTNATWASALDVSNTKHEFVKDGWGTLTLNEKPAWDKGTEETATKITVKSGKLILPKDAYVTLGTETQSNLITIAETEWLELKPADSRITTTETGTETELKFIVPQDWVADNMVGKVADTNGTLYTQAMATHALTNATETLNGFEGWQSYVLGLTPSDKTSIPLITPQQGTSTSKITLNLNNVNPLSAATSGVDVKYKVMSADNTSFTDPTTEVSATTEKTYEVGLPSEGVRYYRVEVQFLNPTASDSGNDTANDTNSGNGE